MYSIGRKWGHGILTHRHLHEIFSEKRLERVRQFFRDHGSKTILIARFISGFRVAAFLAAGTMGMKPVQFVVLDSLGALIMIPLLICPRLLLRTENGMVRTGHSPPRFHLVGPRYSGRNYPEHLSYLKENEGPLRARLPLYNPHSSIRILQYPCPPLFSIAIEIEAWAGRGGGGAPNLALHRHRQRLRVSVASLMLSQIAVTTMVS